MNLLNRHPLSESEPNKKAQKIQNTEKAYCYILGDLEDSQKSHTTQHGDAERRHHLRFRQDHLANRADHHEAVETVEQRHVVTLEPNVLKSKLPSSTAVSIT